MGNTKAARNRYIAKYRENAGKTTLNELDFTEYGIKRIFYDDLMNHNLEGFFPIASQYVDAALNPSTEESAKLCFYFAKVYHEIYLGTTGSGKTTGCVEPQLRAITSAKHKPHIFVTDPKGEIFEHNAAHLKKQGYRIRVLNFKDLTKTNFWNPLGEIYDTYIKIHDVGRDSEQHNGPVPKKYKGSKLVGKGDGDIYYTYKDTAFCTHKDLIDRFDFERFGIMGDTEDLIMQFAEMVIEVTNNKDRTWEEGAQRLLRGLIFFMLEETTSGEDNPMTRKRFTLKTLNQIYNKLRDEALGDYAENNVLKCPSFKHKSNNDYSIQLIRTVTNNALNTARSYFGVYESSSQKWFNQKIISLTLDDTMDVDFSNPEPMALFLITRDYEKTDFLVAGLFVDWLYRKAVEAHEKKLTKRELHFILDEFGNIPAIKNFENKIATSRSRNIWFHLILQSYAQLSSVYDVGNPGTAAIIKDNCNSQVFLGSQNYETKVEFSKQCGEKTYPEFKTKLDQQSYFVTTAVLPISQLDLIKTGEMFYKRISTPVFTSAFVRSYKCHEFLVDRNIDGFAYVETKINNPYADEFTFARAKKFDEKYDFDFDDDFFRGN